MESSCHINIKLNGLQRNSVQTEKDIIKHKRFHLIRHIMAETDKIERN